MINIDKTKETSFSELGYNTTRTVEMGFTLPDSEQQTPLLKDQQKILGSIHNKNQIEIRHKARNTNKSNIDKFRSSFLKMMPSFYNR